MKSMDNIVYPLLTECKTDTHNGPAALILTNIVVQKCGEYWTRNIRQKAVITREPPAKIKIS